MNVPTPGLVCPTCSAAVASVDLTVADPEPTPMAVGGYRVGSMTKPSTVSRRSCVPCGHELSTFGWLLADDGSMTWDASPA